MNHSACVRSEGEFFWHESFLHQEPVRVGEVQHNKINDLTSYAVCKKDQVVDGWLIRAELSPFPLKNIRRTYVSHSSLINDEFTKKETKGSVYRCSPYFPQMILVFCTFFKYCFVIFITIVCTCSRSLSLSLFKNFLSRICLEYCVQAAAQKFCVICFLLLACYLFACTL